MAVRDYIVNRSNYTLRVKRQNTGKGSVYERDFMTTTTPGSWEGDVFSYSEGNFKMTSRVPLNSKRKHQFGGWLQSGCGDNENEDSDVWSLSCMNYASGGTDESKIVLRPNYGDMSDFAYYGSLKDLIESTVKYVADKFPAELTITENEATYWDEKYQITKILGSNLESELTRIYPECVEFGIDESTGKMKCLNTFYTKYIKTEAIKSGTTASYAEEGALVEVSNPFDIDVNSKEVNISGETPINPMRYLCLSSQSYAVVNIGEPVQDSMLACICDWEVMYKERGCYNGQLTSIIMLNTAFSGKTEAPSQFMLFEFYNDGKYILLTHKAYSGYAIRPYYRDNARKYLDEFLNGLDDFGSLLLNRKSTPLYTCTIDRPYETDKGFVKSKTSFTWPRFYNYNIDIVSASYENYLSGLIEIADFYDEGYTDNLWNRMTHDAIKNLDQTLTRPNSVDTPVDYAEGRSKIEMLIHLYGRFYDVLKRYADNIKYTNEITYNGYNNIPDYFISDSLGISGWDVSSAVEGIDSNGYTLDGVKYTASDVNVDFMRKLRINSKELFVTKGTKQGLEMILSLFGLKSYDFAAAALKEVQGRSSYGTLVPDETMYDYKLDEFVAVASGGTSGLSGNILDIESDNSKKIGYDSESDTLQGLPCIMVDNGTIKYIVPWFTDPIELDGHPYFQMYGGWGKMQKKIVDNPYSDSGTTELISDDMLYDETLKYINIVRNVGELSEIPFERLKNKSVCYVFDISDYSDYFDGDSSNITNYFYLEDAGNYAIYGTDSEEQLTGWVNVSEADMKNTTDKGIRVLYLESIIDEAKGNNPHIGYGSYDYGETYLDYFRHLFKYSLEKNNFNDDAYGCSDGEIDSSIKNAGFGVEEQRDNVKCWYFTDNATTPWFKRETTKDGNTHVISPDTFNPVGKYASSFYSSDLDPYDFEGNIKYSESAAMSVINQKKLKITFDGIYTRSLTFKEYFYKSINPYLKQMLPSSLIFEVVFGKDRASYTETRTALGAALTENSEILVNRHAAK